MPLSYLLAMVGSFSLAYVVVRFARRYDVASGVAFTYVRGSLGKLAGFVSGWVYVAAWLSSTAVVLAIGAVSASALLARTASTVNWTWIFLVELVIVTTLNFLGVRPSVRLLVLLELVSMLALAGVMIHVIPSADLPAHPEALRTVFVAQRLEWHRLRDDLRVLRIRWLRGSSGPGP